MTIQTKELFAYDKYKSYHSFLFDCPLICRHFKGQPLSLIPIRGILLPVPAISAHFLDAILRFPTQFGLCLGRIAITGGNIARTSWLDGILDGHTANSLQKNIFQRILLIRIKLLIIRLQILEHLSDKLLLRLAAVLLHQR